MKSRPIVIDGETPALFHEFVSIDQEKLKVNIFCCKEDMEQIEKLFFERHICPASCEVIKLARIHAIVEYPGGAVGLVSPVERIKFVDNKIPPIQTRKKEDV